MATVYILQSKATARFYIGSTNGLRRRLKEHLRGHSLATRGRGPWELVYQETFELLADARRREIEIKQWKSAKMIAGLIAAKIG
ncbi:MAG TPA: GIY-YIG nuclease family protein [Verrucomicrobiae bacterium]|nr:GIY-YIG nuclease family protein [Verrucomicrobiae bacterium]